MNELTEKITELIFMDSEIRRCDAILCTGTSCPSIPEYAAKLYREGMAPIIFVGGKYSITKGFFDGPSQKADIYTGCYKTEAEFYTDVLLKNGVPKSAVLAEEKSTYTKENAVYARELAQINGIELRSAILLSHSFHSRRAYMYYRLQFPQTELLSVGVPLDGVTREGWYMTETGRERVFGELRRIGEQFTPEELKLLMK